MAIENGSSAATRKKTRLDLYNPNKKAICGIECILYLLCPTRMKLIELYVICCVQSVALHLLFAVLVILFIFYRS